MIESSWNLPNVVEFFAHERNKLADLYKSEWQMLEGELRENISVLDIGCAQGGFARMFSEKIKNFNYSGVDLSPEMILRARRENSRHRFEKADFAAESVFPSERFDLVICFGVLHLTMDWKKILLKAWAMTNKALIFDVRETTEPTIQDKNKSFFRMDWNGADEQHTGERLPYIVLNSTESLKDIQTLCPNAGQIEQYGYFHQPRDSASVPYHKVITKCYKLTVQKEK